METNLPARSPFPTRALIEATLGYGLIVVTVWSPMPMRNYVGAIAALWISVALLLDGMSQEERGFSAHAFWRGKWALTIAISLAVLVTSVASAVGTLHIRAGSTGYKPPMVGYLIWSLIQQVILQLFLVPRLMALLRSFWAAVLAASILFSAAHLPNPLLTLATLIWGIGACWLFSRYQSVLVVALIHFMLGACLAISVPAPVHRNMRVGLGYLHYRAPARAQLPSHGNAVFVMPAHGASR
jgi:membrane protease YdiL (CAAX protease family)